MHANIYMGTYVILSSYIVMFHFTNGLYYLSVKASFSC